MIHFSQVSKEYLVGQPVLDCVDLHIKRGEFVYVVGRSGAGKSTFLKLIFANERPTSGSVAVGGFDTRELSRKEAPFFRRKIGVVYQDFKLLPRRTVFENVAFALEVVGRPKWEIEERVTKMLADVGLTHCISKRPGQLSGGEQQRVAIARALVRDPWILLADEPTGNLDPGMTKEIMALFARAHQRGTTMIMATHDQSLLMREGSELHRVLRIDGAGIHEERPGREPGSQSRQTPSSTDALSSSLPMLDVDALPSSAADVDGVGPPDDEPSDAAPVVQEDEPMIEDAG